MIGGAFLVAFTAHTLLGMHLDDLIPRWPISADTWMATGVAQSITYGHLSRLYTVGGYDALPLWPMLLTPVVALANALGLSGTRGIDPSLAQLVLPYSLAVGVLVLHAGRSLAWALGTRSRLWILQICLVVTVVLPCAVAGHLEDALAVALLLYGARRYLADEFDASALLVGLAVCSKQWAVLVLPLLIVAAPAARRVRYTLIAGGLPALLGGAALMLDFHHAFWLLLAPSAFTHNPGIRHGAAMLLGERGSRLVRPLVLATSLLLAMRARRRGRGLLWPAAIGVLLLRPLVEPLLFPYYLAPGTGLLLVAAVAGVERPKLSHLAAPTLVTLWSFQGSRSDPVWWAGLVILLAWASLPILRNPADRRGRPWGSGRSLERAAA